MKHLFVINPAAGKRDRTSELTPEIESVMSGRGEPFEIYVTSAPMAAVDAIRGRASDGDALRVYACGGDGTLNECVNGAAGLSNVAVTHYPTGTGNDFCKLFGNGGAAFRDLRALVDGETRRIDLIECLGRYSVNICSVGVDARIGTDVHKYSGLVPGRGAYLVSAAANLIKGVSRPMSVTVDGETREGDYSLICACNGRFYGGSFYPMPEAVPDDGLLDFLIIRGVSRLGFLKLVGKFKDGRYKELPAESVEHIRGASLRVSSGDVLRVNADGELLHGREVEFAVRPGLLNFFFPRGASW